MFSWMHTTTGYYLAYLVVALGVMVRVRIRCSVCLSGWLVVMHTYLYNYFRCNCHTALTN